LVRARRISDLAPSKVQTALKAVRDDNASLRSVHHYMRAVKAFSRWLWRDGRAREDTLAHLTSPNPDADRRHERRALAHEEVALLVQAAVSGPVVLRVTGPDRAALYRAALGTGFRANELRSLRPEAFDLDGDPPTITVAAAYSKRRRDDMQPIRPDLADALRPWLASKAPGQPVFGNLTKHTNELIRSDLERVGIPYRDASGRVADFHALRHTYITALAMSNAPVKVVQSLARHSTPTLTLGMYAHVGLYDQTSALDALPDQSQPDPAPEAATLPATGTHGPISKRLALHFPYGGDGTRRNLSVSVANDDLKAEPQPAMPMDRNPLEPSDLDAPCQGLTLPGGTEGVGFEPTDRRSRSTVFKTVPINHSGTPPRVGQREAPGKVTGRPRR
jgi:integrase